MQQLSREKKRLAINHLTNVARISLMPPTLPKHGVQAAVHVIEDKTFSTLTVPLSILIKN